ncbi:alcohol dehydrogenase catalytic domain-containing protein [Crossiella cryophila]|uniref:Threonine dehydrogenase-like Zn-dependent dehydrogenase n=1 Tax=Crossiella cryophila TaxID=43355 RepID=A0A7W7CJY5_9PSEU|nr:alcohol dehydrogenase catalytic domain-containing protein [Crossiella cryophila]MBB4681181.1 threonine dehydrogenase-like Zn-dependent dehydrogenase [Crossiella cryophila]
MKAVTWHGKRDVRVRTVPDPVLTEPHDVLVRITSTGICGSDLHPYELLGPLPEPGDVLGHEPMGIVQEVGPEVTAIAPGDRVVVPCTISCGACFMCDTGLHSQCETGQVRVRGTGGQAEYLRVPFGDTLPIKVPAGPPDDRFVYLSDVLPAAWQAVAYAAIPPGGSVAVLGLGPIGDMATRIARHLGAARVLGLDLVPERLDRARRNGIEAIDVRGADLLEQVRDRTGGRGPDAVIDAVGMAAQGSPIGRIPRQLTGLLPESVATKLIRTAGVGRLHALHLAIDLVRRGGTISVSGVYRGLADPLPLRILFDKQIQLRMGQVNVHRWVADLLPLLGDDDPLGTEGFATHRLPLAEAPHGYELFRTKQDGAVKVLLTP